VKLARGAVKFAGLFGPGDHVGGRDLNGHHGALLFCCPDEAEAIEVFLAKTVDLHPVGTVANALESYSMVALDLKNQRDAREEENARLRHVLRELLDMRLGKIKKARDMRRIVETAYCELQAPLRGAPVGEPRP
jgi:DNA-directed RNA polymerase specialized sigma54-like protein